MPLTPAHAAIAWPLSALLPRLPVAALVIGTMSPDYEYLLRLAPRGDFGHSLAGLVVFCLPISVAVWVLYERFARDVLARMLPRTIGGWLSRSGAREPLGPRVIPAAIATLVGALSHVAWDGFTHVRGWAVLRIPALSEPLVSGIPAYKALQHGSTVVGLVVVVIWVRLTLRRVGSETVQAGHWWAVTILGIGSLAGAVLNGARVLERGAPQILGHAAVGAMVGCLLATIAVAIIGANRERAP